MKRRLFFLLIPAGLVLVLCLLPKPLSAAEVYYLGSSSQTTDGQEPQSFTLKDRVRDLFDFGAFGDYEKVRSGQISGSVLAEVDWNHTSGNTSKSFLERGTDYLGEINVNAWERLWKDYKAETRLFLRKTDDKRIEDWRDVRLKDLNVSIYNSDNRLEFGDFYEDFSAFTLGSTLEGLKVELNPIHLIKIKGVAARSQKKDYVTGKFERHVFGGKIDFNLFENWKLFNLFRLGAQVVTSQDDSSSAVRPTSSGAWIQDLSNTVVSLDGEIRLKKYLSLDYGFARSAYEVDSDEPVLRLQQTQYGTALRIQPRMRFQWLDFRYLYYYVQPSFYTDTGSASTDKVQHQFSLDITPGSRVRLSLVENFYRDHLERSSRGYQTVHDEKYVTLSLRPWEKRQSFDLRTYFNYYDVSSDDQPESSDNHTITTGVSVNDRIWEASLGARYEYRAYSDRADGSRSDYFNRFGFNLSRDFEIFGRRLYQSADISADFRNSIAEDDNDIAVTTSLSGQYDAFERLVFRYGFNVQNSSAATADAGYVNTRSYFETDFLVGKKRGSHLISKIERNVYNHEDGEQDYNELRVITKFVSQF